MEALGVPDRPRRLYKLVRAERGRYVGIAIRLLERLPDVGMARQVVDVSSAERRVVLVFSSSLCRHNQRQHFLNVWIVYVSERLLIFTRHSMPL